MELPDTVVVLGHDAQAIRRDLLDILPALDVQVGGTAPDTPFAVIAFNPDAEIAPYRDAAWVHVSGAGVRVMLDALHEARMTPQLITRTVGRMGAQIGEYVASYILADRQRHAERSELQGQARWDQWAVAPTQVAGEHALILGTGGIGSGVATTLSALGMSCCGASRNGEARDAFDTVWSWDALPAGLNEFGVCIAALPDTPDTRGILDAAFFSRLEDVQFFNVGRGVTVDETALLSAMPGHVRTCVLDVFATEPLPEDSPLWSAPGVTVTPHVSGLTQPRDTAEAFSDAYRAVQSGKRPQLSVDTLQGY